jgi:hypothetical protein
MRETGHPLAHAIRLADLLTGARVARSGNLERENHEHKVIVIRGDAFSCVLVGVLVVSRLPAYGQAVLRFLRDLNRYRDGK